MNSGPDGADHDHADDGQDGDELIEDEPVENELVENELVENERVEDGLIENELVEDEPVEDEPVEDDLIDSDVTGTQSKVTKVRVDNPDASVFDRDGGVNSRIGLAVAAIVAVAVVAAVFITRSANNTDLKLVQGSVQEILTPDCFWTIVYELENATDDEIAVFDTKVGGNASLIVTQAARDLVVPAGSTAQNAITYYVDNCPADPAAIEHDSLDVLNVPLGGTQQTTRLEF